MNDRHTECTAVCQVSTDWIVLMSVLSVSLSALLIAPAFGESGQAVATGGFVSTEALVLYVGYGALTRVANSAVRKILAST